MENEINTDNIYKREKVKYALFAGIGLLLIIFGSLVDFQPVQPRVMSMQLDQNLPPDGWNVTEDLGVGEVPGGLTAQRFELRQDQGWEVLAYCLNPEEPPPPVGTSCGMIDDNTFWCGDQYQQLREYQILQQPPPEQTETTVPTATATNTVTATPTMTQTPTATEVPTNTSVPTQSFTPTPRPKMGGSGNFHISDAISLTLGIVMVCIGIILAVFNWMHQNKKYK